MGVFISYLLYMPCKKIEEAYQKSKVRLIKKKARGLSVLTVYIIVMLLILILINFILPVVLRSVVDLIGNIQNYFEATIQNYNNLPEDSFLKGDMAKEMVKTIQDIDIKQ